MAESQLGDMSKVNPDLQWLCMNLNWLAHFFSAVKDHSL